MLPKMIDPVLKDREALAPYNFVPLPNKLVSAEPLLPQNTYHVDRFTGTLACTLTTASPLYVRCGYTPEEYATLSTKPFEQMTDDEKRTRAQFFSLDDPKQPVVPGSSLRGMLRALVEIVSYGKMDKVTDVPRYFYRAVAAKIDDPLATPYRNQLRNVRAGYVRKQGRAWFIQPARTIGNEAYLKVREQDIPQSLGLIRLNEPHYHLQTVPVSFTTKKLKPSPRNPQGRLVIDRIGASGAYSDEGWIVTSGNMLETGGSWQRSPRKNHAVIGEASSGELKIADTAVEDYRNGLSSFVIEQLGPNGVLQDGQPVFYCEPPRGEREIIYFGHNPNFRLPFRFPGSQRAATPFDFVPTDLHDDAKLDLAEAIFGYVRRSKKEQDPALAGRVFISDAKLEAQQTNIWYSDEPIIPHILATPKPTTFQHYLKQSSIVRPELKHYASKLGEDTVVRGHKLYWHKGDQPNIGLPGDQQDINDTQKTQIRPVRAGVSFAFDVRFENLSEVELGALLWVLQLAADDEYRLSLGMGKPLGMGAVKIESQITITERQKRYETLFDDQAWATGEEHALPITAYEAQHHCIDAFQSYVIKGSCDTSGSGKLRDNLRIQCLLALLRWPGPQPAMTRYMEIERDVRQGAILAAEAKPRDQKVNEYKLRPVLPSPLQVTGEVPVASDTPTNPQHAVSIPQKLTVPTLPVGGDTVTWKVKAVDETIVILEVPGFSDDTAFGALKAEQISDGRTTRYKVGNSARVEVIDVRTLKNGRVRVELKPAPRKES